MDVDTQGPRGKSQNGRGAWRMGLHGKKGPPVLDGRTNPINHFLLTLLNPDAAQYCHPGTKDPTAAKKKNVRWVGTISDASMGQTNTSGQNGTLMAACIQARYYAVGQTATRRRENVWLSPQASKSCGSPPGWGCTLLLPKAHHATIRRARTPQSGADTGDRQRPSHPWAGTATLPRARSC